MKNKNISHSMLSEEALTKRAFTLAEVLITLTIIGVIAALTIPNLMQSYQEHVTVTKVKKFYSTLSNAYSQSIKENGTIDTWGLTDTTYDGAKKVFENLIKPYFKIAKICGPTNDNNCVGKSYKKFDSSGAGTYPLFPYYKLILADGASIWVKAEGEAQLVVFYDVNNIKEPNQIGKDTFEFIVFPKTVDKIVPTGVDGPEYTGQFDNDCYTNGYGCTAWLVYKGNMEYLHCSGLTWNGKNKCK